MALPCIKFILHNVPSVSAKAEYFFHVSDLFSKKDFTVTDSQGIVPYSMLPLKAEEIFVIKF